MALKNFSRLWTLCLCLVATGSSKIPSITDPHFINDCVEAHNEWRGKVNPPAADMKYMVWDKGLSEVAQTWAKQCKSGHSSCLDVSYGCYAPLEFIGENIWSGGIKLFTPKQAIALWYNETKFYDFNSLSCSEVCSHYTQVVWAKSVYLGCAAAACPDVGGASSVVFVCNYGPAGNFANMPPYTKGQSCSLCSKEEKCVKNLCRTPQLIVPNQNPFLKPLGKAPQQIDFNPFSLALLLLIIF
ncbi:GLIPR1-like protein 1 isoform X1 [Saimiri boliviensis]|uniref:GLIPR1 like 1 n=1 Tax=Saimiri boliviensis boliviensis TaxID=39432 RepID=A0A2K6UUD9_SAIBB|nr:GLIPR1-like protein 1 isoform X1 [Saimiri boliviensis boliviensis]